MADKELSWDELRTQVVKEHQESTARAIRNNLQFAVGANPEQEAGYKQIATTVGVPVDTVRADPAALKTQSVLQEFDAYKLAVDHPHTANFLTDLDNSRMIHDDVPGMTAVEQSVKALSVPNPFARAPQLDTGMSFRALPDQEPSVRDRLVNWWTSMFGGLTAEQQRQQAGAAEATAILAARKTDPSLVPPADATPAQIKELNDRAWEQSRQAIGGMSQIPLATAERFVNAASFGLASPTVTTTTHSWQASLGAGLGSLGGFIVGPAKAGGAALEMIPGTAKLVPQAGEAFVTALAKNVAQQAGVLGIASGLQEAGGAALDSHSAAEAGKRIGHGALTGAGTGTVFGAAGRLLPDNTLAQWAGRFLGVSAAQDGMLGMTPWDDRPLEDKILSYGMNALFTAHGAGRTGGNWFTDNPTVRQAFVDANRAQSAQQAGETLATLSKAAAASKLRERDPAAFREFVQKVADDGNLQEVYIDARELANALHQSGISAAELAATLPNVATQLHEASQTNGDVRIPVADYAAHIAGGQADQAILPHLKTEPDGMTYRQGQEFIAREAETMKAQADKIVAAKAADDAFQQERQAVYDHFLEQDNKAQRFSPDVNQKYAALMREFYTVTADKLGITPTDMLKRYPLLTQAEKLAGSRTLEQMSQPEAQGGAGLHQPDGESVNAAGSKDASMLFQGGKQDGQQSGRSARSGLHADEELHTTVAGGRAAPGWTGATRASRDGRPVTFYRGASQPLVADHFDVASLGKASGKPSSGLGVWFTPHKEEAASYGKTAAYHLDVRNPKIIKVEDLPGFDSVQDAHAFREKLRREGYDSIAITAKHLGGKVHLVAFDPEQVIRPKNELFQSTPTFYSALQRAFETAKQPNMPADQWLAWLNSNAGKLGVKRDEIQWTGIEDYLALRGKDKVSREEVAQFLADHGVQVEEVEKGGMSFNRVQQEYERAIRDAGYPADEAAAIFAEMAKYAHDEPYDEAVSDKGFAAVLKAGQSGNEIHDAVYDAQNGRAGDTKYSNYTLPGGDNYRELLLTLPRFEDKQQTKLDTINAELDALLNKYGVPIPEMPPEGKAEAARLTKLHNDIADAPEQRDYQSTHWDEQNILAHVRFNDRTDADGKRVLFIEELQSDWGQEGKKKGFGPARAATAEEMAEWRELERMPAAELTEEQRTRLEELDNLVAGYGDKTPAAPFVTDTKAWLSLGIKRMIRYAAEHGYDRVAFVNGRQSADRYDLSKQISRISFYDNSTGGVGRPSMEGETAGGTLDAYDLNGNRVMERRVESVAELENLIGKEAARKLLEAQPEASSIAGIGVRRRRLEGLDLKVGGEGMKAFYDQIVPQTVNDVLKKIGGGKAESVNLGSDYRIEETKVGQRTSFDVVSNNTHDDSAVFSAPTKEQAQAWIDANSSGPMRQPGFDITPQLRERVLAEGLPLFQDGESKRGAFDLDTHTIVLFKDADLSTYLHESAHFFLEVTSELASRADAPEPIKRDMETLLDWFGVKGADGESAIERWNRMSLEEKREAHEQFARGFEAYLMEGKAPSVELASLFARFRAWLLSVYKSLSELNVSLTPEVRGVMDRMLASEEAIRQAEQVRGYEPLFKTAEAAGMTPEEFADYQRTGADATQQAIADLDKRSMRDMQWLSNAKSKAIKALQKEADAKRRAAREEVTREVMAEPVNRARTWLRKGEMTDAEGNEIKAERGFRLTSEALQEMYPEGMLARPDLSKLRGMTAKDGLHPDLVADMFGFASGADLVNALLHAEPAKERIAALTDQRMLEKHGELATPEAIERAAEVAIHNEARARFVATELKALSKATGPAKLIAAAAKEAAEAAIAAKRIADIRPAQYTAAESRAARAAEQALAKNDIEAAAFEKRAQLLNNRLAKVAADAVEEVAKGLERMKRLQKAAAQDAMRGEFRDQLNALLARFDLRSSVSNKEVEQNRVSLAEFMAAESERLSAVMPDVPAWLLNENFRTHFRNLTVEQFRGLLDTVKQLELLARREQKQYMAIRKMEFAQERDAVLERVREFHPEAFEEDGTPRKLEPDFVPSIAKSVAGMGDKFAGEFLNAETILSILEGGKFGQVNESLFGRMSQRADWKATRLGEIYKEMKPFFEQYSLKERYDFSHKDIGQSIGLSLTRENALVVALLHGNADGRERLTNYGWNEARQTQIINLLDARDMKLADAIWRLFDDNLWPELKALNERTRGKAPAKVQAMPYETKHGKARGGYFRLKYDTELDERAHRLDEGQAVKELLGGSMGMSAKTNQGSSTERVKGVVMRPRLDLGVFAEAVNETVHDLAYREAVADTMRMLNDADIQTAIKGAAGVPAYRALVNRVREIAAPPRNPSGFIEKALTIARKNTIVTLMSGVKSALQNFTGLIPALARVNSGLLLRETVKFYSPRMKEMYEFTTSQSEYMRNRHNSFDRDLQDMAKKLTVNGRIMPDTGTWLALMGMIDKAVSTPIWNAAFAEGMKQFGNDRAKAVDYADHIVRQTQGSGRDLDLAAIMSGHGGYGQLKRMFTMFYSYFNGQLNMLVRSGAVSKQMAAENPALACAKFAADFMLIVVLPAVLTEMFFSPNDKKDDQDKGIGRYVRAIAMYGAGMFPIVRDVASYAWASFDHSVSNYGMKISPVQSAFEGTVKGAVAVKHMVTSQGDDRDTKNAIMGTGFLIGLPGKLIADTTLGVKAWLEGKAGPEVLIKGPPK